MAFCTVQLSENSLPKIISCIYNIANICGNSHTHNNDVNGDDVNGDDVNGNDVNDVVTYVISCSSKLRDEIINLNILPTICSGNNNTKINIDFFIYDDFTMTSFIPQWIDSINYCIEKYGHVYYFSEDMVLFRKPDFSHLTSNIGFVKHMCIVPNTHYSRLFSRDFFYCSDKSVFDTYSKMLLDTHNELVKLIPNNSNNTCVDNSNNTDIFNKSDITFNHPIITVNDYVLRINNTIYDFINSDDFKSKNDESSCTINGSFVFYNDFFGSSDTKITLNDIDFSNLTISKHFNQQKSTVGDCVWVDITYFNTNQEDETKLKNNSLISDKTNLYGICLNSNKSQKNLEEINDYIIDKLSNISRNFFYLLIFKMKGYFPFSMPFSGDGCIAHWNRDNIDWFEGLRLFFLNTGNIIKYIKFTPSLYDFKIGDNIILAAPSTKYLSNEYATVKNRHVYLTNSDINHDLRNSLSKCGINNYKFAFYYPERSSDLEEFITNDNHDLTSFKGYKVFRFFEDSSTYNNGFIRSKDVYKEYLEQIAQHSFVFLNKKYFNSLVVAESISCRRPIIVEDGIEILDLEKGKHYITEDYYNTLCAENTHEEMCDLWKTMSNHCHEYYTHSIKTSVVICNLIKEHFVFTLDLDS